MSKAADIASALSNRIALISGVNGYATDIGQRVFRGRMVIDQSEVPCTVLVEGEDRKEDDSGKNLVKLAQRYIIEGHAVCDPDQPNDAAHNVLSDIKRAIFGGDRRLGNMVSEIRYIGRNIGPRPDGTALVAASIEIEVVFVEDLTNP